MNEWLKVWRSSPSTVWLSLRRSWRDSLLPHSDTCLLVCTCHDSCFSHLSPQHLGHLNLQGWAVVWRWPTAVPGKKDCLRLRYSCRLVFLALNQHPPPARVGKVAKQTSIYCCWMMTYEPPETPWDPLCLIYTEQSKEGSLKGMFLLDNIIGASVSVSLKIPSIGVSWLISFSDHLESQDELWSFQTGGFLLLLGQLLLVLACWNK